MNWNDKNSSGCWGVKISRQRSEIAAIAEKMFKQNHLHKYDYDQQLLDRFYQPMAKKSMVYTSSSDFNCQCASYITFPCQQCRSLIIFRWPTTATAVKSSSPTAAGHSRRPEKKTACSSDGEKLANPMNRSNSPVRRNVGRQIRVY
jgi:hypothetical protein